MTQSSLVPAALPAWVPLLLSIAVAAPRAGHAQMRYRTTRSENFRQLPGPDQRLLGTVSNGTDLVGGPTKDGWVEVTLSGWIWGRSTGKTDRDSFDLAVTARNGENLRTAPNGAIQARLATGFLLKEISRNDAGWVQVRRSGWMWAQSLKQLDPDPPTRPSQTPPPPGADSPSAKSDDASLDRAVTARATELRQTPEGEVAGSLAQDAPVRIMARSGDWVRVATEGWIRESDLKPSARGVLVGVSGAEVRARPRDFEGKLVQWTVQYVALQTADELRQEIPQGQQYLLTRGPLPESGFVYAVPTASQLVLIQQLPPLAELVVIARVKVGRSRYLGNPVVDLVDVAVRQP